MNIILRTIYLAAIVGVIVFASMQYVEAVLGSMAIAIITGGLELWFDRDGRREDSLWDKAYETRL